MKSSERADPSTRVAVSLAVTLAIVHLVLALWFANITPYRKSGRILSSRGTTVQDIGNPDERQHANYIRHLLDDKGFPVFNPKDPALYENYQSHQPPLYYLIGAGWGILTQSTNVEDQTAGIRLRSLNAAIGAIDVFMVFCLGWWGFQKKSVGLCAAAFAALLPMNVALSASISNDPLLFLFCTSTLAVCALAVWDKWTVSRALMVGVLTGFALLTKTTALALLPAVLVAVVMSERRPKPLGWVAALVPIFLMPLGWWIRNQSLYGDPFAITAFNQAFVGSAQAKTFIDGFGMFGYLSSWVGWWTLRSFFGAFGYMDIWLNETGLPMGAGPNLLYRLLLMGGVLAFIGWIADLKSEREKPAKTIQAMNAIFILVVVALFLKFNFQYFQAQARYLLPAIGPISCGFGLGVLALTRRNWWIAATLLILVLGGTSIYAGLRLPSEFEKRVTGF